MHTNRQICSQNMFVIRQFEDYEANCFGLDCGLEGTTNNYNDCGLLKAFEIFRKT